MKSRVYFARVNDTEDTGARAKRLSCLIKESGIFGCLKKNGRTCVKIHFGEEGNPNFVLPEYAKVVCDAIKDGGARPFLSDANVLYRSNRTNSKDHIKVAAAHGFTKDAVGVDVIIPDDTNELNVAQIPVKGELIKKAYIARAFIEADFLVAINHFKAHMMTGFGGAIKNIGMGCATRTGKLAQHSDVSPVVYTDECTGCGECVSVCPADAVTVTGGKAVIAKSRCIGCASCMAACPTGAMFIDLKCGEAVQKKMAEYAAAVLNGKKGRACFLNFALKIARECDCWAGENAIISPDVGIFASLDPVAIDKASFDIVNEACGDDIFRKAHPDQDGSIQLGHAEKMGIGNIEYELIKI